MSHGLRFPIVVDRLSPSAHSAKGGRIWENPRPIQEQDCYGNGTAVTRRVLTNLG